MTDSKLSNLINNYYNNCKKEISNFIEDDVYKLDFITEDDKFIVDVYKSEKSGVHDKQNKKKHVLKSYYEVLGCYNVVSSIWTWSYATYIERNLTKSSRKIKKYHKKLVKSDENIDLYLFYTANTSLFITYKNLQELLKFGLYISNGRWLMSYKHDSDDIIEFIILTDIIQYIK